MFYTSFGSYSSTTPDKNFIFFITQVPVEMVLSIYKADERPIQWTIKKQNDY